MYYRRRLGSGKKKRISKQTMMSIFIISVMVLSVLGFVITSDPNAQNSFIYEGREFLIEGQYLTTEIEGGTVRFHAFPDSVTQIQADGDAVEMIRGSRMAYITFDPNSSELSDIDLARYELSTSLREQFDIFSAPAVISPSDQYKFPVIGCENATESVPVISFVETNATRITREDNCIIFNAKSSFDFLRLKDRLLYQMHGII